MHEQSPTRKNVKAIKQIVDGKRFIIAKAFTTDEGIRMVIVGLVDNLDEARKMADFWQCKVIAFKIDYIVEINPSTTDT